MCSTVLNGEHFGGNWFTASYIAMVGPCEQHKQFLIVWGVGAASAGGVQGLDLHGTTPKPTSAQSQAESSQLAHGLDSILLQANDEVIASSAQNLSDFSLVISSKLRGPKHFEALPACTMDMQYVIRGRGSSRRDTLEVVRSGMW